MTAKGAGQTLAEAGNRVLADYLSKALEAMGAALTDAEGCDPGGSAAQGMEANALVAMGALVQDLRRRLGDLERDLVVAAGKALGKCSGELDGGRLFTLTRASDRKAWDHEEWKRDARRAIVGQVDDRYELVDVAGPALVDTETGEPVSLASILFRAVAAAQEVHGATAPRSTSLKALGLYATDYCESSPAGWRLTVTPPPKPDTTTTDKD